ncbi:hypothetical protein QEN19_003598 [Hanseniaspora menglaensis]
MLLPLSILVFSLQFLVFSEATKVFYKPFELGEKSVTHQYKLLFEYSFIPESSSFMVSINDNIFEDGKYCLSLDSRGDDCFQIADLRHNQSYDLVINSKNHNKISLKTKNTKSNEFKVFAVESSSLKMPKTPLDLLKKTTKKYEDLKKNNKQTGSNVKNNIVKPVHSELENLESNEKEPSFLVKYWRYILLGFLVYKIMSSTSAKSQKQE